MTFLEDQIASARLDAIFRGKTNDIGNIVSIEEVLSLLSDTSSKFSIQYVSFGLLKYLKFIAGCGSQHSQDMCKIMKLLLSKFSESFRPQPMDVIELIRICISSSSDSAIGDCFKLLSSSLRNQLGNPKNVFLTICDEVLPLLNSLDKDALERNIDPIRSVVAVMFQADANMSSVSAWLLRGATPSTPGSEGRKRKSVSGGFDSYVGRMFESLEGCRSQISCMVLQGYVSRLRREVEGETTESSSSDEEFKLFSELLSRMQSLESKLDLWNCMHVLKMYRLREESGAVHRAALKSFLSACISGEDASTKWRGLEIVLTIDPVNFTEECCGHIWDLLRSKSLVSDETEKCICKLFKTFAVKGSLCEIINKTLEASASNGDENSFQDVPFSRIFAKVVSEVSPIDLIESVETLFGCFQEKNGLVIQMLQPLIDLGMFATLPENLLFRASQIFASELEKLSSEEIFGRLKKAQRSKMSILMLILVDGLRKTRSAWSLPYGADTEEDSVVEKALTLIAEKDSKNRCSALLRLSFLCNVDVKLGDLTDCADFQSQLAQFANNHFLTIAAVWNRFEGEKMDLKPLLGQFSDSKMLPDALLGENLLPREVKANEEALVSDLHSLLVRSREIADRYPRILVTPPSLRKTDFPHEIIALEMAWSSNADKSTVDALIQDDSSQDDAIIPLFGLSVIFEEARRNKTKISDICPKENLTLLLESMPRFPLLAQIRFLLAVHSEAVDLRLTSELLATASVEVLNVDKRDRPAIDSAYYALFQAVIAGKDKRKIRLPWWTNKMVILMLGIRGLIGCCISAVCEQDKVDAAQYVVRLWKSVLDGVSTEKFHRISKSVPLLAGEFIRLSGQISNPECVGVLEKGCCLLLDKLSDTEKQFLHASLGKNDRETLKRINDLLHKNFKYKGKV